MTGKSKFDKGDLDQSIAAIQHVLDNNHLNGRERDALWSDVESLRRMREAYYRHEIGYRYEHPFRGPQAERRIQKYPVHDNETNGDVTSVTRFPESKDVHKRFLLTLELSFE